MLRLVSPRDDSKSHPLVLEEVMGDGSIDVIEVAMESRRV
jgi:hypothetical protein